MQANASSDIVDFNLFALFGGLNFALRTELESAGMKLKYDFDPDLEFQVRGNCDRLGQTLTSLIRGAIKSPGYGDIRLTITSEALQGDRVLLQFEISSCDQSGPTYRYFAGLPRSKVPPLRQRIEIRS